MTKKVNTYRRVKEILPKLEAQYSKEKATGRKRLKQEISQYKDYISKIENHIRIGEAIYLHCQNHFYPGLSKQDKVKLFDAAVDKKCRVLNDVSLDIKIAMCRKYLLRHGVLIDKSIWEQD